jgi:hypothetical protein
MNAATSVLILRLLVTTGRPTATKSIGPTTILFM